MGPIGLGTCLSLCNVGFLALVNPLIHVTCHAPIHRTFVLWIMTCHLASFLAQIHLHTITNQHLWNSLVFNPMLPFIPPLCMVFMPELTVKTCRIRPSTTMKFIRFAYHGLVVVNSKRVSSLKKSVCYSNPCEMSSHTIFCSFLISDFQIEFL